MGSTGSVVRVTLTLGLLGSALFVPAACSANVSTPDQTASETAQTHPSPAVESPTLKQQTLPALPFTVVAPAGALDGAEVIALGDELEHAQVHITGYTEVLPMGLPGPSVRTLLTDGRAFAAKMEPLLDRPTQDLADVPSTLGLLNATGTYEELSGLTEDIRELPGSNVDALYFEPQDASSFKNWVVWREGSAGSNKGFPTLDTDDFRIVLWDRDSGEVLEVASSFLLHSSRFAPRGSWSVPPYTDGYSVYFEAVIPSEASTGLQGDTETISDDTGKKWAQVISKVPIAEPGNVSFLARGTSPVATEDGPFWIENSSTVRGLSGPEFEVVSESRSLATLTTDGQSIAATVVDSEGENAWILIWSPADQTLSAAVNARAPWAQSSLSGDTLVWGNGTSGGEGDMHAWHRGWAGPKKLGRAPGMSIPHVKGSAVAIPSLTDSGAVIWAMGSLQ